MLCARECISGSKINLSTQLYNEITNEKYKDDALSSLASAYLKKDEKQADILAKKIKYTESKDRFLMNKVIYTKNNDHLIKQISSNAIKAYCQYFKFTQKGSFPEIELLEAKFNLCCEKKQALKNEFALKLMRLAIKNDRFDDVVAFSKHTIVSPERSALIFKSFRCTQSKEKGLKVKRSGPKSMVLFANGSMYDSIIRYSGRKKYLDSFMWSLPFFFHRRYNTSLEMTYPIIVNYSNAVKNTADEQFFLRKSVSPLTLNFLKQDLDTYAEISVVSMGDIDTDKVFYILSKVKDKQRIQNIIRKYVHILSQEGKYIEKILEYIK